MQGCYGGVEAYYVSTFSFLSFVSKVNEANRNLSKDFSQEFIDIGAGFRSESIRGTVNAGLWITAISHSNIESGLSRLRPIRWHMDNFRFF
jgi:hypothetical protein